LDIRDIDVINNFFFLNPPGSIIAGKGAENLLLAGNGHTGETFFHFESRGNKLIKETDNKKIEKVTFFDSGSPSYLRKKPTRTEDNGLPYSIYWIGRVSRFYAPPCGGLIRLDRHCARFTYTETATILPSSKEQEGNRAGRTVLELAARGETATGG
jgi:hypothetical protein